MQFSGDDDRVDRRIIDGSRSVDGACAEVDGACAEVDGACAEVDGACAEVDGACAEVDGACAEVVGACAADSDAEFDVSDAMNSSDSDIETFANDDSLDDMNDMTLGTGLADWATRNACSRKGLNEMLDLLRSHGHRLPKDARTLLHTPRNVQTVDKCGGQYIYYGMESGILRDMAQSDFHPADNHIKVNINIDGVPLYKSRNIQFWPILCSVDRFEPFIVALFCGSSKPNPVDEFLHDFIQEAQELKDTGLFFGNTTYHVTVNAFICDAPARAFLKRIR